MKERRPSANLYLIPMHPFYLVTNILVYFTIPLKTELSGFASILQTASITTRN
ncbi:hypothetical protein GQ53DRAFT_754180 [Thozetella sp. PMI_491]|nr:hypothetical protein GQ53DRAFT_754180 [Thozetella sp. PMI_491]